jgi:hypothetical protein
VCYRLFLASPLTLSEMRAMLPDGVAAHLVSPPWRDPLLDLCPAARDAVSLSYGGCACDLAGRRLSDPEEDERRLRARYRALGAERALTIQALEIHRRRPRGRGAPPPPSAESMAWFVGEHARNAGPALYYLSFIVEPDRPLLAGLETSPVRVRMADVRAAPDAWLADDTPTLVLP